MYLLSIEVKKHEWKFGRTRNAARKQAECFHSFFEFSETFMRASIKQLDYEPSSRFLSRDSARAR